MCETTIAQKLFEVILNKLAKKKKEKRRKKEKIVQMKKSEKYEMKGQR